MMKILSIYAMLAVVLSACNMLAEVEADTLELLNKANEEMVFLASGGEKTIVMVTNSDWTAESDAQWCKVSPGEGTAESAKIKMTVEMNDKAEEREATITVSTAAKSLQMKVIQREKKSILLEEEDFVIDAEEEKHFMFSVTASGTYFVMPYISGGFTGYVYWGDGTSSPFSSDLEGYPYDNDTEHTVEMKLSGSSEDFVVEFKDIKGLVKVDLSNM